MADPQIYRSKTDDGRNIDLEVGSLTGEASSQVTSPKAAQSRELVSQAFPYVPSRQSQTSPSYYDHPMLKAPVWIWSIPTYFYVGGATGVSATFGAMAQLLAPDELRSVVRGSHWIGTIGGAISAGLLVYDLGRPALFLNMLRVLRIQSPMSVGSWILTIFSTAAGAAAVLPFGPSVFHFLVAPAGLVAGLFGLGLAGYTGVLISQTAVPLWQQAYRLTPALFLASGTAAASSLFDFFSLNEREHKANKAFGLIGKSAELGLSFVLEAEVSKVARVGRPLRQGLGGFLWQGAKVLTAASIIVTFLPGKSRKKNIAVGVLGSAASLCLRLGIFYAGKASALDARASFEQQRALPAATHP